MRMDLNMCSRMAHIFAVNLHVLVEVTTISMIRDTGYRDYRALKERIIILMRKADECSLVCRR